MIKAMTFEEIRVRLNTEGKFSLAKANTILLLIKNYDYKDTNYQDNRNILIQIIDLYNKLDIKLRTFISLTYIM